MGQRERESVTDSDPQGSVFDSVFDSDEDYLFADEHTGPLPVVQRVTRSERRHASTALSRRRKRRVLLIMSLLLVVVVAVATWLVVLPIYRYLNPADYDGSGSGTQVVLVKPGDDATAIADTLVQDHVVASVRAFTDAAKNNSNSSSIQPGAYKLRHHMSATSALAALLDPSTRINSDVVIPEGATTLDIIKRLTAATCATNASSTAVCGAGMSAAAVRAALSDVAALGLPTDYQVNGKAPTSVEGFLYPATYYFPDDTSPTDALGQMISNFTDQVRSADFTAAAQANHLTPYQQLIVASIAEAEAKFPEDYAKVARVILNRIAEGKPLQIDATSAYGAKLAGKDPSKVIYATFPGPYNSYLNPGLPPTPIDNPGAAAMNGAAHPAAGDWTYYVNGDAAGHLFFTNSETAFQKAVQTCQTNHWGCG